MFDSGSKLKHLPFFEELASLEENSEAWNAATAGLVALRLVDSWLESGIGHASDEEWNYRSVCESVAKMSERSPMQSLLTSVLLAMRVGKPNIRAVVPSLMAYAKAQEWDAKWELAADVYHSMLAHLHPLEDGEACIEAHRRIASCHKTLGNWDRACQAYASVFEVANATGDVESVLLARTGEADIDMLRGNLPVAASKFEALIEAACTEGFRDVRARALAGRSSVAALGDHYELAIRLAYEALKFQDSPTERDRVLSNIAGDFISLGVYSAARDTYLVLTVTAQEQYTRWVATMNLLELSARTGSEVLFEQYHRQLSNESLPPQLQAAYHLTLGEGLHRFGHLDSARKYLESAIELSHEFGLGQYLIVAETALAGLETPAPTQQTPAAVTAGVEEVVIAMRKLRELAEVG